MKQRLGTVDLYRVIVFNLSEKESFCGDEDIYLALPNSSIHLGELETTFEQFFKYSQYIIKSVSLLL